MFHIFPREIMPRKKLPDFTRASEPPAHTFTKRDQQIVLTIHEFDGVLADYQIDRLFFHNRRQMYHRMSKLFHNAYVAKPDRKERYSLDYTVYWLDTDGAQFIAQHQGLPLEELSWRKPGERWSLTEHDIELNDVRIAVNEALAEMSGHRLIEWIPSRAFWADPDQVSYTDHAGHKKTRFLRPDGYFHIVSTQGERTRHSRLLLELDRRTEHNPRFLDEKVLPGIAYLHSPQYKERFSINAGRYLVVTTGADRVENMVRHAEKAGKDADLFLFTTLKEALTPGAFFVTPIWRQPGRKEKVTLFTTSENNG